MYRQHRLCEIGLRRGVSRDKNGLRRGLAGLNRTWTFDPCTPCLQFCTPTFKILPNSMRDITSRMAKAASAMYRLSNPLFRKHRISIQTKFNMYRALVVSVLLYGSEAWATSAHHPRRRLDVFDMRCQRRLLRVFWQQHISNHSIRERTKQPTASSLLRQRRLR